MEEQRTIDWYIKRIGYITGSRCGVLMCKGKGKEFSQSALSYIYQIASERVMNPIYLQDEDKFQMYREFTETSSKSMRLGTEIEPVARQWYEKVTGNSVEEVGSLPHPTIDHFSASPDGIVTETSTGRKGTLEIKCPSQAVWMQYVAEVTDGESLKKMNSEYYYQTIAEMLCSGTDFTDFVVFNPLQSKLGYIVRIEKDDFVVRELELRIQLANQYIDNIISKIA